MGASERYAFIVDWLDPHAGLTFKYQLMYYTQDGSIEMYDIKNRRMFLKKSVYPAVTMETLYVGSTITVFSRQLKVTEYADVFTKKRMDTAHEKTFAMVKPDAFKHVGKIVNAIYKSGFQVAKMASCQLTRKDAEEFYAEHKGKAFFENLIAFMTSGPVVAMELVGENAVLGWRSLLGPTNTATAQAEAPNSIRARFGSDGTRNACHGSDSATSSDRELGFFFGPGSNRLKKQAKGNGCSCLLVKPHAVISGGAGQVMDKVNEYFNVQAMEMFTLDRANAMEFYEVYKGVVPEYMLMVEELTSGPLIALEVLDRDGENPVESLRELCGPTDPEIARVLRPQTLRAAYGVDKKKNGVHCTDLPEDGALEVNYFFNILQSAA